MRKKIFLLPFVLLSICIFVSSCNKDDDDTSIDEEWKSLNETRFNEVAVDKSYNQLASQTDNGNVYWKTANFIADGDDVLRISPSGNPEFTDTVVVRYEGWYFDKNGEKVIFDSTEGLSLKSEIAYLTGASGSKDPNKQSITYPVSGGITTQYTIVNCSGVSTLLQDMKTGEERVVCVPQQLAYGSTSYTYTPVTNGASYTLIPAYTTLWFNVKLIKIISMSGLS